MGLSPHWSPRGRRPRYARFTTYDVVWVLYTNHPKNAKPRVSVQKRGAVVAL